MRLLLVNRPLNKLKTLMFAMKTLKAACENVILSLVNLP
jgi:hypothetical protein